MDQETKAALDALKAEIAALKARLEPEDTSISLIQYAHRIGFSRESARRLACRSTARDEGWRPLESEAIKI